MEEEKQPGAEEEKQPGAEEEKQPGAEEEKQPGAEEEKQPGATFTEAIEEIRHMYEAKIAKMNDDHKRELEERTEVIKQLLTGDKSGLDYPEEGKSIADKINQKRKYEF